VVIGFAQGHPMTWRDELRADLKRDEGYRSSLYKDSVGKWTIGYGWNIADRPIREEEAVLRLGNDINEAIGELALMFPWFEFLSPNRKRALTNMMFNLGRNRFLGFKKMIAAIATERWEEAANEALNSKWAAQVGNRAQRIAELIRSG